MSKNQTETVFKIIRFQNGIDKPKSRLGNFNAYYKSGKYIDYITRTFKNEANPKIKINDIYNGDEIDVKGLKQQLKGLNKHQAFYDTIISFSNNQTKNFDLNDPKLISKLIGEPFKKLLIDNGHNKDNINAFFAIHTDTNHHHIHLGFYEKNPSFIDTKGKSCFKKIGLLKEIDKFKKAIDNNFNELNFSAFYKSRIELLNNLKISKNKFIKDANFEKLIEHFLTIPKKTNKSYFFNNQPKFVKNAVLSIFEKMKNNDPKLKKDYENYLNLVDEISKKQYQIYKNHQSKFKYQNLKGAYGIEPRIGNKILNTVKQEVNKIEKSHNRKIKIYQLPKKQPPKIERRIYFGLKKFINQLINHDYEKQKWDSIQKFRNMQNDFRS